MAGRVFRYDLIKAAGGRATRGNQSNSYDVSLDVDITAPEHVANADYLVLTEIGSLLSEMQMRRVHIKEIDPSTGAEVDKRFKSIERNEIGYRQALGAGQQSGQAVTIDRLLPFNNVLAISRDASEGISGRLEYRGMMLDSDVEIGLQGGFVLKDSSLFQSTVAGQQHIVERLNDGVPHGQFVMIGKGASDGSNVRPVEKFRLLGVRSVQQFRQRISPDTAMKHAIQRELHAMARKVKKYFAQTVGAVLSAVATAAIKAIQAEAKELLTKLLPSEILGLTLPEVLFATSFLLP
jgi:hypothetical protein